MIGVDLSNWQAGLGMREIKSKGAEFVIIRAARGDSYADPSAPGFYMAARAAGIPAGVYSYSYATSPDQAEAEARFLVETLGGWPCPCGVFMDVETTDQLELPNEVLLETVRAWCAVIRAAGYTPGVYGSEYNLWAKLKPDELPENVLIWVAHYGKQPDVPCDLWQSTDSGSVDGYLGAVDVDVVRSARFERLVKAGMPRKGESGRDENVPTSEPVTDACPIGDGCASTDISVELALLAEYLQTEEFQAGFLAFVAGKEHIA